MMTRFKFNNNTVDALFFRDVNIINPWGIETSDSSGFFSLESGVGYRYEILHEDYSFDERRFAANLTVRMPEGRWRLMSHDSIIGESKVFRRAELECLENSYFLDFVMRFRFRNGPIEYAEIDRTQVLHDNSHVYHQYSTRQVLLVGRDFDIRISCKDVIMPETMKLVMYVSDQKGEWIVHIRMLPKQFDKEIIKLCNFWFKTRPIPQPFANLLLRSERLKRALWYRGEVSPYKSIVLRRLINPVAFPLVSISKGARLLIDAEVIFDRK